MTTAELERLREEAARGLVERRRKAAHDAIDLAMYDAEREAADAWALVDRLRAQMTAEAARARIDEVTRIVKWLRGDSWHLDISEAGDEAEAFALRIERGDHLK